MTSSTGYFFHLVDFDWFGSWGLWLQSAFQTLDIILFVFIIIISLVHCIFSKALNACSQPLLTKQMVYLRLDSQKGNEENDCLKESEPEDVACACHRD